MKKVLILGIGCDLDPWKVMFDTSQRTWDSVEVEGVESIFYWGHPVKENTDKCIYFPVEETYAKMGHKLLMAFDWVLQNKEFDYIARVNSSCYVDKRELIKYVQTLENENVFAGLKVDGGPGGHGYEQAWHWGGGQFVLSKDVIQKIVDNKEHWRHDLMEDVGLSYIVNHLQIPYTDGKCCGIDRAGDHWRAIIYGGGATFNFTDFESLKHSGQHFYRCKQDLEREKDEYVMNELFRVLK